MSSRAINLKLFSVKSLNRFFWFLKVSDLGNLIGMYREWHSHLLPYYSFDQFVHKVENVAATNQVKVLTCLVVHDSLVLLAELHFAFQTMACWFGYIIVMNVAIWCLHTIIL